MSELTISPTPTPPPSGTGNAKAVSQSDASSRSTDSATTGTDSGTTAQFAAVLKSQMGKKAAAADTADKHKFVAGSTPNRCRNYAYGH